MANGANHGVENHRGGIWSNRDIVDQSGARPIGLSLLPHGGSDFEQGKQVASGFWRKVANSPPGAQQDWDQVFAKYSAAVDNPGCCVWRELLAAYPDAKVLLTLHPRGAEAWYESTIDTIYFTESMWQFKVLEWLTPFGRKFGDMSHKLIWQRSLQGTMTDKAKAIARYNAHVDEVKAAVPADKLLIFRVDQGWAPLCAFLGVPQPAGDFPEPERPGGDQENDPGRHQGHVCHAGRLRGRSRCCALRRLSVLAVGRIGRATSAPEDAANEGLGPHSLRRCRRRRLRLRPNEPRRRCGEGASDPAVIRTWDRALEIVAEDARFLRGAAAGREYNEGGDGIEPVRRQQLDQRAAG